MASRAVLHHAALKISPPPRTLRDSREIYRSLKKFGEIDLYRNHRYETSTGEAKEDAMILFRDQIALNDALAASPLAITMPPPPPSPIPSIGDSKGAGSTGGAPPVQTFTVEVLKREFAHEMQIIDKLVKHSQPLYPINQEGPPGVSVNFNTTANMEYIPLRNEYDFNLARAAAGVWKSWRAEIRKAGIPGWETIKAVAPDTTAVPPKGPSLGRQPPFKTWGHPAEPQELKKKEPSQPVPQKVNAISNPTPLPPDPTMLGGSWLRPQARRAVASTGKPGMVPSPQSSSVPDSQGGTTAATSPVAAPGMSDERSPGTPEQIHPTEQNASSSVDPHISEGIETIEQDNKKPLISSLESGKGLPIADVQAPQEPEATVISLPDDSVDESGGIRAQPDLPITGTTISANADGRAVGTDPTSFRDVNSVGSDAKLFEGTETSPEYSRDGDSKPQPTIKPSSQVEVEHIGSDAQGISTSSAGTPDVGQAATKAAVEQTNDSQAEKPGAEAEAAATPEPPEGKKPWWKIF
ncbi:hypothetical protein DRE_05118 [Drechslerella stenobrocha 248]|uniref:Uncharacterized protein n=1 Tax=Drechslerella stenobrocha 248 TaxID=1043628 RepID=W7HNW8_9PEZI|nr:hypothetical protein DRE_05118 [Drechslerella stenobrocha 248]